MLIDEVCNMRYGAARRGGLTVIAVAFVLLLAACGNEAENTDTADRQPEAEQNQAAAETGGAEEPAAADTESESTGNNNQTKTADSGDATETNGGGNGEADAKEEEEQEREPMDGRTVYNRFCTTCHRTGLNAAPKLGNKQAWEPRIAKGKETLYKNSIEGFKGMPAKGGIAGLYDQEVKDAVDYMVGRAGGWDSQE